MSSRWLTFSSRLRGFNIRRKKNRLRQKAYPGLAIASEEALYFVVDVKRLPSATQAILGMGGALGGLLGGMLEDRKQFKGSLLPRPDPLVEEMDLADLPEEIAEDPDWPVDWEMGWVLEGPSRAVRSLRTSFWVGGIEVELRDVYVVAFTPIFRRKQLAGQLVDMGWDVEGV